MSEKKTMSLQEIMNRVDGGEAVSIRRKGLKLLLSWMEAIKHPVEWHVEAKGAVATIRRARPLEAESDA